jgi:hypothetical protein
MAQFKRALMLERQREGTKAKAEGKYKWGHCWALWISPSSPMLADILDFLPHRAAPAFLPFEVLGRCSLTSFAMAICRSWTLGYSCIFIKNAHR